MNIDRELLNRFVRNNGNFAHVVGSWRRTITRADGTEEVAEYENTLTSEGLNLLASRGISNTNSAFAHIAVGTQTAASSLGSTQAGLGEVSRKLASTITTSNERMIFVATWAGAVDAITGVALETAGVFNAADSGSGVSLNFVNSVSTTLQDSDYLKLEVSVRVGSHNL